jgi:hypothetical protein
MKTEVPLDMLNFVNAGFVATVINLDARRTVKNPESRSISLPIFALI